MMTTDKYPERTHYIQRFNIYEGNREMSKHLDILTFDCADPCFWREQRLGY